MTSTLTFGIACAIDSEIHNVACGKPVHICLVPWNANFLSSTHSMWSNPTSINLSLQPRKFFSSLTRSLLSQFHFCMWCQRNSLRFYYKLDWKIYLWLVVTGLASKWNRLWRFTHSLGYVIIVSNFQYYYFNMWRYFLRTFLLLHSIWHGNYTKNVINFHSMEFLAIPFGISLTNDDESNRLCILNFRA